MRVAFAGTPDFAAQALQALHAAGHEIVLVLTQPDRPSGRGLKLQPSPVKALGRELGLAVIEPRSLRLDGRWPDDARSAGQALQAARPEVMVVAAYGLILPQWVLALPPRGCLNIHASLLPRWRGAAPIERAIEAGDTHTGITIMQMDEGLDTGDLLLEQAEPIAADDTGASLRERLARVGATLIVRALQDLTVGQLVRRPQSEAGACYAAKLGKHESPIDWRAEAAVIERRLRAFDPFPGCTFSWQGETVKLWRASAWPQPCPAVPGTVVALDGARLAVACGSGVLEPLEVQRAGGVRVPFAAWRQAAAREAWHAGARLTWPSAPTGSAAG
jgi:methionyl-tRNA formyltransferase